MKCLLVTLIFVVIGTVAFAKEHPQQVLKLKSGKTKRPGKFRLCEVSQSGTIGSYLTQVTITCTSKAPTCELASLGASICVRFQITDAYTKLNATLN